MSNVVIPMIATVAIIYGSTAYAQNASDQIRVVRECVRVVEAGNAVRAGQIAEQMLEWSNVVANISLQAADCLSQILGERYEYIPSVGFLTEPEIESLREEARVERSRNVLDKAFSQLGEVYSERNLNLISQDIYLACSQLVETDPQQAFTNSTCIATFRQNGHPKLEDFPSFAITAIPAIVAASERDAELLNSLTESQISELCREDYAALCVLAGVEK